ncbi:MAG TPA: radical SAM protein [Casimicrobiaceae bacterium]|jgi:MoaA/NifB/PqqE/SkfB family radical SAM enzyme|nr:radical SAM protein [Casimicrobiaceae bacterium]
MKELAQRVVRHARLNWQNLALPDVPSPPFLILFINSICNMKCEHCFYWKQLNQRDDLSFEEIVALSRELGPIENLNLSGGEPFLRKEFDAICRQFIRKNGVKEIYVPTNGWYTDKTVRMIRGVLEEPGLKLFGVELSLDGMPAFHDEFRKARNSFRRAMQTYDALAALQNEDPRLQIHAISVATERNMGEIRQLTTFLYDRCPKMSHHNLAIIRGDRKNPTLQGPSLEEYRELYAYIRRLWAPREEVRFGAVVEPMLQWAKLKAAEQKRQFVACRAGVLTAVVHANGDVGVCEQRPPIGNLRKNSFREIWHSHHAGEIRGSIRRKECYCTNEIFMWPSIVFQPVELAKSMIGARVWERATPLGPAERADYAKAAVPLQRSLEISKA